MSDPQTLPSAQCQGHQDPLNTSMAMRQGQIQCHLRQCAVSRDSKESRLCDLFFLHRKHELENLPRGKKSMQSNSIDLGAWIDCSGLEQHNRKLGGRPQCATTCDSLQNMKTLNPDRRSYRLCRRAAIPACVQTQNQPHQMK